MPAHQRHRDVAAFGHGDHRCIGTLVAKMGSHGPDEDAGSANADNRPSAAEQIGNMRRCLAEMIRRVRAANGMTVDIAVNHLGKPSGDRQSGP